MAASPAPTGSPETWPLIARAKASFYRPRSGDLVLMLHRGVVPIPAPGPGYVATHGSPWDYDRRVPMLFWRGGMTGFEQPSPVETVDIAPTLAMYTHTSEAFARAYWHWFFLIQPPPLPEGLIEDDPVRFLRSVMGARYAGLAVFDPAAMAEYERCIALPGSARGICSDYRASAGIDLVHDRADVAAGLRVAQPLRVLWGDNGIVGKCFDVLALWRERALDVSGRGVDSGHYLAEEVPQTVLDEAFGFFRST
jgi:hypothetical protein